MASSQVNNYQRIGARLRPENRLHSNATGNGIDLYQRLEAWKWIVAAALVGFIFSLARWGEIAPFGYAWYVAALVGLPRRRSPAGARVTAGGASVENVAGLDKPAGTNLRERMVLVGALVGAAAGLINLGWQTVMSSLLAGSLSWGLAGPLRASRRSSNAQPPSWVFAGAAAVVHVFLLFLVSAFADELFFATPLLLLQDGVVFVGIILFEPVWRLLWQKFAGHYPARLDRPTQVGLLVGAALWVAVLAYLDLGFGVFDPSLVVTLAATLMAAAAGGPGAGAAAGVVLGLAQASVSHRPAIMALAAVGGLFAGSFPAGGRWGAAAWYGLGMITTLLGVFTGLTAEARATFAEQPYVYGISYGAAALLFLAAPPGWREWVRRLCSPPDDLQIAAAEAMHLRRQMTGRLRGVSEVLQQVASVFDQLPTIRSAPLSSAAGRLSGQSTTVDVFLREVDEDCCQSCAVRKVCWKERSQETYWALIDLLAAGEGRGETRIEDIPAPLRRRCIRPKRLVAVANRFLYFSKLESHWQQRVWESRRLVGGELRGLAQLMDVLAAEMQTEVRMNSGLSARLEAELAGRGFPPSLVTVVESGGGRREIETTLWLERAEVAPEWVSRLSAVLSVAAGLRLSCQLAKVEEETRFDLFDHFDYQDGAGLSAAAGRAGRFRPAVRVTYRLTPAQQLQIRWGTRVAPKTAATVSGDAVIRFPLGVEREVIAVSDGMGNGWSAADESQAAMEMLRRLLVAGFSPEFAVRTLNAALLLRSEERFATLDLLTADLHSGFAELIKIGSPPTFLLHGNTVQTITASTLPVGILAGIPVEPRRIRLYPGDLLVLTTDGVIEAGRDGVPGGEWLARRLVDLKRRDPQEVADELFAMILERTDGELTDDTTIVVVQLEPCIGTWEAKEDDKDVAPATDEYVRLSSVLLPPLD